MAGTGTIGDTPEFMYLADGTHLYLYIENGFANGTISGTPANNDTCASIPYYKFTNGSVNAGAPAGTLANPWLVALGASTPTPGKTSPTRSECRHAWHAIQHGVDAKFRHPGNLRSTTAVASAQRLSARSATRS
jgi:hypothetical protein